MAEVTIAVPTFRRPKYLRRLLVSLAALRTDANVRVLVGDNDAHARDGMAVCEELRAAGYRWPLEAIAVSERGISQNRNALVARALEQPEMQFLAMLDDDEWVEPRWLDAILSAQARFNADVVEGAVFAEGADLDYQGLGRHRGESGPAGMLESSANILIARGVLESIGAPHFDVSFALTGGEDKDFFMRAKSRGARFAWSAEAVVNAAVPETRASTKWLLTRAYSNGNSDMRVFLRYHTGLASFASEIAKIAGALLLSPLLALILLASPNRRMKALRKFFRAAGKMTALFGSQYQEYSVIHGE